ncbi:MAG: hypothetical protein MJE66_03645 [Proteobacteria bacterium]|nr:hypothetical protein [Pseudomonadota bacterium]
MAAPQTTPSETPKAPLASICAWCREPLSGAPAAGGTTPLNYGICLACLRERLAAGR